MKGGSSKQINEGKFLIVGKRTGRWAHPLFSQADKRAPTETAAFNCAGPLFRLFSVLCPRQEQCSLSPLSRRAQVKYREEPSDLSRSSQDAGAPAPQVSLRSLFLAFPFIWLTGALHFRGISRGTPLFFTSSCSKGLDLMEIRDLGL